MVVTWEATIIIFAIIEVSTVGETFLQLPVLASLLAYKGKICPTIQVYSLSKAKNASTLDSSLSSTAVLSLLMSLLGSVP